MSLSKPEEMELTEFMDAYECFVSVEDNSNIVGLEKPNRPTSDKNGMEQYHFQMNILKMRIHTLRINHPLKFLLHLNLENFVEEIHVLN